MKKVLIGLAAMAMMGMMMTSCQKEEEAVTDSGKMVFTATTENSGSKTHLDGLELKWDADDEILVFDPGVYAAVGDFSIVEITNDGSCATFEGELGQLPAKSGVPLEGDDLDGFYLIAYPGICDWDGNYSYIYFNLPATQEYVENSVKGFPMYAETENTAFQFTNLCGLFRLQLQKTGKSIRSITITTDKAVNGAFDIDYNGNPYQLSATETTDNSLKSVTLDCGNGVSIDELTDFNIYLPVSTYSTFDITITATDGTQCVKSLNGNTLTINRNERVTLTREGDALEFAFPEGTVHSLFTVNADGKQVYFAKGNLQNVNGQWQFAEHQYDYLGTYSATAWDCFGWSTAATNFGMSTSTSNSYSGSFVDWGTQIGDGETWYTLSSEEWRYVLKTRTGAASKRGVGTVNGVPGLILLPDTWTLPADLTFNSGFGSWARNRYIAAEWEQMEAAGAVFLPAAGYRYGSEMLHVGSYGYYWSSTPYNEYIAYFMDFRYYLFNFVSDYRSNGRSVRLVQDY